MVGGDHSRTVWEVSYTLPCLFESKIVLLSPLTDCLDSVPSLQIQLYSCCLSHSSLSVVGSGALLGCGLWHAASHGWYQCSV